MNDRQWGPGAIADVTLVRRDDRSIVDRLGVCFFDAFNNEWVSPSSGRIHPYGIWDVLARPLVVIDVEDREHVKRLADLVTQSLTEHDTYEPIIEAVRGSLREFVKPKPTKPEEPAGLGAVVCLSDGTRWIRYSLTGEWWFNADEPATGLRWADLDVVEVLTEGVTA